jgi:hypothetical protein
MPELRIYAKKLKLDRIAFRVFDNCQKLAFVTA